MTAVVLGAGCKPENDPNNGGGNTHIMVMNMLILVCQVEPCGRPVM